MLRVRRSYLPFRLLSEIPFWRVDKGTVFSNLAANILWKHPITTLFTVMGLSAAGTISSSSLGINVDRVGVKEVVPPKLELAPPSPKPYEFGEL